MVLVRVARIGGTSRSDPFRAPLPTYETIIDNDGAGNMIVDVPAEDIPPQLLSDGATVLAALPAGQTVTAVRPAVVTVWKRALEARYNKAQDAYQPNVR